MKTLQTFTSVHASVQNHFNKERHLVSREIYEAGRSTVMAEWRCLPRKLASRPRNARLSETSSTWTDSTITVDPGFVMTETMAAALGEDAAAESGAISMAIPAMVVAHARPPRLGGEAWRTAV